MNPNDPARLRLVNNAYVIVSLLVYGLMFWRLQQSG